MSAGTAKPSSSYPSSSYRPDINGLRAAAVLAVTLFHLDVPGFSGGFVGVDVFYVISGYLMTSIITRQMIGRTFSFASFYRSRLLRIYPPMLALIALALGLAYAFLGPQEYIALARNALASVFSVVNIQFYLETNYFAPAEEATWLLHLWSLSLEVQFYLVFPMLLWLSTRGGPSRRWIVVLPVVFAVSLIACGVITVKHQLTAFFLMPTRIWEFLAGALAYALRGSIRPLWRSGISLAGIAIIMASVLSFNGAMTYPGFSKHAMAYPGFAAIVPVLGAAMVLGSPSKIWPLANPVSQFFGTISYSLYLWHWPVWVAARHFGLERNFVHAAELMVVSTVLATVSYYGIEKPSSRLRHGGMAVSVSAGLATAMGICAALAGAIIVSKGLPRRAPELVRNVIERYQADLRALRRPQDGLCFLTPPMPASQFAPRCFDPRLPSGPSEVLIWGDSYAAALWFGLANAREFTDIKLPEATAAGCPPFPRPPTVMNTQCEEVNRRVLSELDNKRAETVFLFARWQYYDEHGTDVVAVLQDTLESLKQQGHRAVIIGPNPEWTPTLPDRLFLASFFNGEAIPERLKDISMDAGMALDARLSALAEKMGVGYVSLFKLWCDQTGCLTHIRDAGRDELLDYDYGHMTVVAAEWLANHVLVTNAKGTLDR